MPTASLQGAVALDRLLRTKRPVPIAELIDEDLRPVRVDRRPGGRGAPVRALRPGRPRRSSTRTTGWSA